MKRPQIQLGYKEPRSRHLSHTPRIRVLTASDVPAALELSSLASWNQTAEDWRLLLNLASDNCFGIEVDDRLVATATLVCYGWRLGWIGMVLTHPEFRGQGFARKLFEHILEQADKSGIRTLKLDATEQGKPLYEKYGFKSEQVVEGWGGKLSEERVCSSDVDFANWQTMDAQAFGADRVELLRALKARGECFIGKGGYLLTRPGRMASYLGPLVAETADAARELLFSYFSQRWGGAVIHNPKTARFVDPKARNSREDDREWHWDLLPENKNALAIARELGFSPKRSLTRMFRGHEMRGRDELVYATAGFELG